MPKGRVIIEDARFSLTLDRLCHQLIERYVDFENVCLVGIQPRGVALSDRIIARLREIIDRPKFLYGKLDITFYRDDFRRQSSPLAANPTNVDFTIEGKRIILIDDVLYTGRTVRSAMDAMLTLGRPDGVELLALVDRKRMRELPIEAEYVGLKVDTMDSEKVIVRLKEGGGQDTVRIESR